MQGTAILGSGAEERWLFCLSAAYWITWSFGARVYMCQPDCLGYYAYLQSLLIDGDLAVANEFAQWRMSRSFTSITTLGQANNLFACGSAILWLPFVAVAHALLLLARSCGADVEATGFGEPYLHAVSLASAWYGYLALVLSYRLAKRVASSGVAAWATVASGTLTTAWHYLFFDGALSHAVSAFANALFAYFAVSTFCTGVEPSTKRSWWSCARLGLAGGLVTLVRWQDVIFPGLVGLLLLCGAVRSFAGRLHHRLGRADCARREITPLSSSICFGGGWVVGFFPQLLIWHLQHGTPVAIPQGASFFHPSTPQIAYVLFSSHHGLFIWTPLVLLSVTGLVLLTRTQPRFASLAIIAFVLQTYVNSIVLDPAAGVSFGSRRFTGLTVIFVVGLASLLTRIPRYAGIVLTMLTAAWTLPLWLAFHLRIIDQVRFVSFGDLSTAVLRTVTNLPHLVHTLRPQLLEHTNTPSVWTLIAYGLAISAVIISVVIARNIAKAQLGPSNLSFLAAWTFAALSINFAVAFAAIRSAPVPVRIVQTAQAAHVDFGAYANSRFDQNPFDPTQNSITSFHLPPELQWGDVPFKVLSPPGDQRTHPSILTTCGLPLHMFSLALKSGETRALHLALGAAGAGQPGLPVVSLLVETISGNTLSRTLHADSEIWDLFKAPPSKAIVHDEITSITGFTLRFDPPIEARTLKIASPLSLAAIWPCVAVYALTQELATDGDAEGATYHSVSLAQVANADHSRNAFQPSARHNYFPQLQPGVIEVEGIPFLLLDHNQTASGQSALTNAKRSNFSARIPLAPTPSTQLSLLISAWMPADAAGSKLAEIEVDYDTGSPTIGEIVAGRDVVLYPSGTTDEGKLRAFTLELDSRRIPQALWFRAPTKKALNAGIAIFALTQLPDASSSSTLSATGR